MKSPYEDIIDHPHYTDNNHPQMSMHDRAAQFAPFAALSGYDDAVNETMRLTDRKIDLDEQELEELNRRLAFLTSKLSGHPSVTIRYFVADKLKSGGEYKLISGKVFWISIQSRKIQMGNGIVIPMDDVVSLSGSIFAEVESF